MTQPDRDFELNELTVDGDLSDRPASKPESAETQFFQDMSSADLQFRGFGSQSQAIEVDLERSLPSAASVSAPGPSFGRGRPHPPLLPDRDDYLVDFDGPDDPSFPQNWRMQTR